MDKGVWVARDADGDLYIYEYKPVRNWKQEAWVRDMDRDGWEDSGLFEIHSGCFPNLLWDDDPVFINFDVKDPNAINFF